MSGSGWEKVSGIFRAIASRWSDCTDQRVELLAAGVSGDLAYIVDQPQPLPGEASTA